LPPGCCSCCCPGQGYPRNWDKIGGGFENGRLRPSEIPTKEDYGQTSEYNYSTDRIGVPRPPASQEDLAVQFRNFSIVVALAGTAFAQSGLPIIGSAGYLTPVPLTVAPGQLVTLFVPGFGNVVNGIVKAPAGPLPTTLAGISAVFRQGSDQPVPIFEVQPIKSCTALAPPANSCGFILAVTVQIPFNIETICPLCLRPISLIPSQMAVSINGVQGQFADLTAVADQVHFLTACDVIMPAPPSPLTPLPCAPMATHADGKLVSAANPARAGEELSAYTTGLGQTNPPQTTGQPALTAASTLTTFAIDFNYRPNALATKPAGPSLTSITPPDVAPLFTGTTQGFVGLYQVNFTVPAAPAGLQPCAGVGTAAAYANVVQSNLTVSVGSVFSFDGAGICVLPGS
jgi:uncharacterized protein (TIGR03437 family)